MTADDQKRAVGEAAAALVDPGVRVVGLGTGSTAAWFVRALAERVSGDGLRSPVCVATSKATAQLAVSLGLELAELDEVGAIDLTVDGADEVGPGLALIKGAGAALLHEKLVWEASRRCVVIADAGKRVAVLGRAVLPVEVTPFGHETTLKRIVEGLVSCGAPATPRLRLTSAGQPFVTDAGNLIYDAPCGAIMDPPSVEAALKSITGVVDHGLFLDLADVALIGGDDGVVTLRR